VAPPIFALLSLQEGKLGPSAYAKDVKSAGLEIITWSLERSGLMAENKGGWYYQTVTKGIHHEGAILEALDVLAKDVGIRGIFSDWPATTTFYANCMGLK
jgi:glycerophosphoryl diester phosphodiesterase